VKVIPETRRAH